MEWAMRQKGTMLLLRQGAPLALGARYAVVTGQAAPGNAVALAVGGSVCHVSPDAMDQLVEGSWKQLLTIDDAIAAGLETPFGVVKLTLAASDGSPWAIAVRVGAAAGQQMTPDGLRGVAGGEAAMNKRWSWWQARQRAPGPLRLELSPPAGGALASGLTRGLEVGLVAATAEGRARLDDAHLHALAAFGVGWTGMLHRQRRAEEALRAAVRHRAAEQRTGEGDERPPPASCHFKTLVQRKRGTCNSASIMTGP